MEHELHISKNTLEIDSLELLIRFILMCKNEAEKDGLQAPLLCSADIVTAVYYYRRYPNVDAFLEKFMKTSSDYFHIQWARSSWAHFSKMTQAELSDLVIYQISLVANSEEG